MADKREYVFKMLLHFQGKKLKIEIFKSILWSDARFLNKYSTYRLRINGKWNDKSWGGTQKYFTKAQFFKMLAYSLRNSF